MLDDFKSWNGKKDLLQIITTVIRKACRMLNTWQFHYIGVKYKEHTRSAGRSLAGRSLACLKLIMFISQWGVPWPDTNIMQMLEHDNKMSSFMVKVWAKTAACTKDVNCTYNANQILAGRCWMALCYQWIEWSASCSYLLFLRCILCLKPLQEM